MDVDGTNAGLYLRQQLFILSNHSTESYQSKSYRIVNKNETSGQEHRNYSHDRSESPSTRRKSYQRKKTICILDDQVDVGLALKFILEENGFRVELFNDPLIALEIIKARRYDLFLIDIIMPNMNGFQIKEIMQINKKAKVCFITAFEEYPELFKDELSNLSISGFIQKPVEGDELIKRVNKMLSSK